MKVHEVPYGLRGDVFLLEEFFLHYFDDVLGQSAEDRINEYFRVTTDECSVSQEIPDTLPANFQPEVVLSLFLVDEIVLEVVVGVIDGHGNVLL